MGQPATFTTSPPSSLLKPSRPGASAHKPAPPWKAPPVKKNDPPTPPPGGVSAKTEENKQFSKARKVDMMCKQMLEEWVTMRDLADVGGVGYKRKEAWSTAENGVDAGQKAAKKVS